MSTRLLDEEEKGERYTQSSGNANGKPMRPVLMAFVAIIALLGVVIALSQKPHPANESLTEKQRNQVSSYSAANSAQTAIGQPNSRREQVTSGPATASPGPSLLPVDATRQAK